jgi:hypothetical protein
MPILIVEMICPPGEGISQGLSAAIADAVASAFRSPPGQKWVRLHGLSQDCYSENGGGVYPDIQPVFVHVLKAALAREPDLEKEASSLAEAIARVCNRPVKNVHIVYDPPLVGRIAFGGKLLKEVKDA